MLSKVCYLHVISPFSQYIFFIYNHSYHDIDIQFRKHIQVYVVKNSSCGSLYFWRYTPWKIGFVASPETSLKQVFQVKTS
jgi:hypothetical protein